MASMTDYLEDAVRGHVLLADPYTAPAAVYLALFTTATSDAGGGTEVSGGSYARQVVDFDPGATAVAVSSADVTFTAMPGVTVGWAAIMDAASGGNVLLHGALSAPKTVAAAADLVFPAGDITATFA
jgi:hypothetical protein